MNFPEVGSIWQATTDVWIGFSPSDPKMRMQRCHALKGSHVLIVDVVDTHVVTSWSRGDAKLYNIDFLSDERLIRIESLTLDEWLRMFAETG